MTDSDKHVIDQIYDKIVNLFGANNQLFCLEFPGRVLDESTYAYPVDSVYSILKKPQAVIKEEFRLTDNLFDICQITGGLNGNKLSTTYEDALNLLVPKYDVMGKFNHDRQKLREWLLETIEDEIEVDGKFTPFKASRMQCFQQFNQRYVSAKAEWEQRKLAARHSAQGQAPSKYKDEELSTTLEDYARWIALEAPADIKVERLNGTG